MLNASTLCVHGCKQNGYLCKQCWDVGVGGNGICVHRQYRTKCRWPECVAQVKKRKGTVRVKVVKEGRKGRKKREKGSGLCPHGRRKDGYDCVQCYELGEGRGKGICEHKRRRLLCQECNPKQALCEHGKPNAGYRCVECWKAGVRGKGICRHGKQVNRCEHETCLNFTLAKLGASSMAEVEALLQGKLDTWNREAFEELKMDECDVVYVKPLARFRDDEAEAACHYTNLQPWPVKARGRRPLWAEKDEAFWQQYIFKNPTYNAYTFCCRLNPRRWRHRAATCC